MFPQKIEKVVSKMSKVVKCFRRKRPVTHEDQIKQKNSADKLDIYRQIGIDLYIAEELDKLWGGRGKDCDKTDTDIGNSESQPGEVSSSSSNGMPIEFEGKIFGHVKWVDNDGNGQMVFESQEMIEEGDVWYTH